MTPEDQLLYLCMRLNFQSRHQEAVQLICQDASPRWTLILDIAKQHGVTPLLYRNLLQNPGPDFAIPKDVAEKIRLANIGNILTKEPRKKGLVDALAYLNQRSYQVMAIKGLALELLVYRYPWHTMTRDFDLVINVKPDELSKSELQNINHALHNKGIEHDFYQHHDIDINGTIAIDYTAVWSDARMISFQGQNLWVMCPEDLLISLCTNACRKRYVRLKQLFDLAETVAAYPDLDWQRLEEKARSYNCLAIVYTALRVTKRTIGCELPDSFLNRIRINRLRKQAIDWAIHLVLENHPLEAHEPRSLTLFNHRLSLSLLLPYFSYQGDQIKHRLVWTIKTRNDPNMNTL